MARFVDACSLTGQNRDVNEDVVIVDDDLGLYAVCDFDRGLRDPTDDDIAVRKEAVRLLIGALQARAALGDLRHDDVVDALGELQQSYAALPHEGLTFSLTALVWPPFQSHAFLAQIGSTLAFVVDDRGAHLVTPPHIFGRDAIRTGLLTIEEAAFASARGIRTRSIGHDDSVADVVEFVPGDRTVVVVSDGVHADLDNAPVPISALVSLALRAERPARAIAEDARRRLARDNASVVVVRALSPGA